MQQFLVRSESSRPEPAGGGCRSTTFHTGFWRVLSRSRRRESSRRPPGGTLFLAGTPVVSMHALPLLQFSCCGFENDLPLLLTCWVPFRPGEVGSCRGAAQPHEREQGTRVVLLSSCMHQGGRLDFSDLQVTPLPPLLAFGASFLDSSPVLCYCWIATI